MEMKEINTAQIIDFSYLISVCGDDPEFKKEMIETFVKNTPPLMMEMKDHLKNAEWKKIGDIAHKMKPSFTFMGIHSAKELILEIEKNGRKQTDTARIPDMVLKLDFICKKALTELEDHLNSL
jgi:HPt (histidine-containing phosphotransfer) domain-containing protein